ncbi:30S ribosomal protein S3 [Candidatus Uabimicrobium sp. HlEnr_7]|uniref:30S ribosomal protein S3 n=1 Tax=Candidatus Uabimicrobium helgolandensis TaxID=3095367 RepID=UPI0035570ACC
MGQKVNPTGFRIGITENWRSRWYANKKQDFSKYLLEDQKLRKHIKKNYGFSNIPKIEIERTQKRVNIILHTARPGLIIGRKGANVDKLREELGTFISSKKKDSANQQKDREVNIEIREIKVAEVNAQLVAENVADQLVKRANFRRTMKKAMDIAMDKGVLGIKLQVSGRLGGAEMARTERTGQGKVPLQSLNENVSYGFAEAYTTYGTIGVKVWIYLGRYGKEVVFHGSHAEKTKIPQKSARKNKRKS